MLRRASIVRSSNPAAAISCLTKAGEAAVSHRCNKSKTLRFVTFEEILLKNCSAEDVKMLSAYEKQRSELHRAARKRLYDALEAEEEAEAASELETD